MKKLLVIIIILAAIGGYFYWRQRPSQITVAHTTNPAASADYKNISYTIDGQKILLKKGTAEMPAAPGSDETVTTEYFGNDVHGDFNNDGQQDIAFILTQSGAGTGVFFYTVAALKTSSGYTG